MFRVEATLRLLVYVVKLCAILVDFSVLREKGLQPMAQMQTLTNVCVSNSPQ